MNKVDINPIFNRIVKILYQVGVWREWEGSDLRRRTIKGSYMFAFLLLELFLATSALVAQNRNEFTFLCLVVIICFVIGIKLVFLLLKRDEVLTFLHRTTEYRKDMNETHIGRVNFLLKFVSGYCFMLFVAAIFYNTSVLPWFIKERKLPFFIRFTWRGPHFEIIYWFCYVFVGLGVVYLNISNLLTSINWFLMLNFAIEYEIVGKKLRALGAHRMTSAAQSTTTRDKIFFHELIGLVKAHQNLVKNVEYFRRCFLALFAIQMVTSGMSVCIATFNLAFNSKNNFFETAIYVAITLYAVFDIFMVMYYGNEIKMASDQLSYCLFESDWSHQSIAVQKCVLFVGEIVKQPQQLVIYIYPMDLKTLTMIIKGAYTMFNVLQNFD